MFFYLQKRERLTGMLSDIDNGVSIVEIKLGTFYLINVFLAKFRSEIVAYFYSGASSAIVDDLPEKDASMVV